MTHANKHMLNQRQLFWETKKPLILLSILIALMGGLPAPSLAINGWDDNTFELTLNLICLQPTFSNPFDAVAAAKLRIGELVEAIKVSGQTGSTWPDTNLIPPALLIQAGLRALLSPTQREGLALPGPANPNDPKELILAQDNLTAVLKGGKASTQQERKVALEAVAQGAEQLQASGYSKAATILQDWLEEQGFRAQ